MSILLVSFNILLSKSTRLKSDSERVRGLKYGTLETPNERNRNYRLGPLLFRGRGNTVSTKTQHYLFLLKMLEIIRKIGAEDQKPEK